MPLDIEKLIEQLKDSDIEIIKLANTEINNADLSNLEKEDLERLKKHIHPILENDNLTARFFAKKNLKRINDLLSPADTVDKTAVAEQAFGTADSDNMQVAAGRLQESKTHSLQTPSDQIPVSADAASSDDESIKTDLSAVSEVSAAIEEPAAKPVVQASQAPVEIEDGKKEDSKAGKTKKRTKKIISSKKSTPVEGAWFPGLVAVLNILFYLGISFDFAHDNLVRADAVKVLTSDLMTQVVFGSMILFALSNLFLRKTMNLYSSGRLSLIFSASIISFSHFYPSIYKVTEFNTFKVLDFTPPLLMFWVIGLAYLYSVASIWERRNKFIKTKIVFTLAALYPVSGFVLSGLNKPVYNIFYNDPYKLDALSWCSGFPYYLKPVFFGLNIIIPMITLYLVMALIGNLFTLKIRKSISIILILLLNSGLLWFTFSSYSFVLSEQIALNDGLAIAWNKVYTLSKKEALKPPAWLVSTLSREQLQAWDMIKLQDKSTDSNAPLENSKSKDEKKHPKSDNGSGNQGNDMPENKNTGLDSDGQEHTKPVEHDLSIIEKGALKNKKFETKEEIFEHLDKMIAAWLFDNDNMVSKDSLKAFEQKVLEELDSPIKTIFRDKKAKDTVFEEARAIFDRKRQKLFPEKIEANTEEDEKSRCFLNIQKLSAAVESYNFSKDSEEKFMKKLDFNLLYPKYLPAGIPECPNGGNYSLSSKEGRNIVTCSKHGAPILED